MLLKKWNKQFKKPISLLLLLGLLILGAAAVQPAYAASLTVDSTADSIADDGVCTLREAITNANNDDQSGSVDCAAGSNADTITFSVNGTITLASALPEITNEMTIDGAGQTVTISGDNAYRVLVVNASGSLNLNALTIINGYAPLVNGQAGDGGGILNAGILIVSNSTFTGNSAFGSGGAIANTRTATISNSTFSGNSNNAIFHSGYSSGTMAISNSTIAGNSGGLVYTYGGATLQNTIVANNGTDCYEPIPGGGLTADSSNMDSDGSCDNATTQTAVQLNLGTLADNGGDTQTIALLPGSTAIDAATTGPASDQRGIARPQGAAFDIGAFEAEEVCVIFPVTVTDEAALNEAIACYNDLTTPGSYAINLGAEIDLTASTTTINNATDGVELLINGAGFTVDGQDVSSSGNGRRPFTIAANTVVAMDAITITRGNAEDGGAIWNTGSLTLTNSTLDRNRGCSPSIGNFCEDGRGGAIFNKGGLVNISTSTISNNRLGGGYHDFGGGGIYNTNGGTVNITHSQIVGNDAGAVDSDGGGIHNANGTVSVNSSTFSQNVAGDGENGGALYNNSTLIVSNSTFSQNEGFEGGALYNGSNGTATLVNNTIVTNIGTRGGGIYNGGQVMLSNSILGGDQIWNGNNGIITADANNLLGHSGQTSTSAFHNFTPGSSDIVATSDGTQPTALSDILDTTLQNNGGATETHALVLGSPALDGGDNAICAAAPVNNLDQRGVVRPQGPLCDIGAYELENNPPVATDDAYSTDEAVQLDVAAPGVLGNDTDLDGNSLTAVLVNDVSNGDLTLNTDGSFSYVPDAGFTGDDSFTYMANDGIHNSELATVTITVEMPVTGPTCQGVPATIVGTDGNDILIGTSGDDVIVGLKGHDIIRGKGGNDLICGGKGNDWLIGGSGDDKLHGGPGWDTLFGNTGNDELHGGLGDDWLYGGLGDDLLYGKQGWDFLYGGPGADELYGGPGQDWLIGDGGNDALDGGLGDEDTCQGGDGTDTAVNCEAVYGVP